MTTITAMVKEALEHYHQENNAYPECVIFYRDGVGMGQIPIIKE